MDFSFANINALNTVFGENNIDILPCFFHLIQSWLRKLSILEFRKKNYFFKTKILVMNLKLLAFMEINRVQLISERKLNDYVFLSNNACESLNHLINSLIAVNNNVSIKRPNNIKNSFYKTGISKRQ